MCVDMKIWHNEVSPFHCQAGLNSCHLSTPIGWMVVDGLLRHACKAEPLYHQAVVIDYSCSRLTAFDASVLQVEACH